MKNKPKQATEQQFLEATIERLTFQNEDTGYTVAKVIPKGTSIEVTVVGSLTGVNIGELLHLEGFWISHPQYGRQFEVHSYNVHYPATTEGLRKYLGSGLIRGVKPVTASRIVDHFGANSLDVIETIPHRLREVPGIGSQKIQTITNAWQEQKQIKVIMMFLQDHGVSTSLAVRIYKHYRQDSINIVQNNPYQLARDVYGIGFRTADKIARQIGIPPSAPARLQAGILFALSSLCNEGHCYATREQLLEQTSRLLEIDLPACIEQLDLLVQEEYLTIEDGTDGQAVYLPPFFMAERGTSSRLRKIQLAARDRMSSFATVNWEHAFTWLARNNPIQLTDRQKEAVQMALTSKVSVLTGGPGTGKSTITASIISLAQARKNSVLLAAPTGRAAKRLSEATGLEAKTIHRLLEYKPGTDHPFFRDHKNPLDCDLIIIDETSMVDILLMNHLLGAIELGSHVLLVGDIDQLPSVGPGNVLRDIIASGTVPITRLDTVFRQADDSYIIVNAHRINQGQMPILSKTSQDFYLFEESDPQKASDRVIDLIINRIPKKFSFQAATDIQVLCPMHRGLVGVSELNTRIQEALNPACQEKTEIRHGHHIFRERDRVMQIKNDYDRQVFNGDMGSIQKIDLEEGTVTIDIDHRLVMAEYSQLDELTHAYAVSIHKSQGSEFPVVIIPLLTQHYMMLQRNLLYTAITRARKLVVLVGSKQAIAMAVRNNRISTRNTRLSGRLQEYSPPPEINKIYVTRK